MKNKKQATEICYEYGISLISVTLHYWAVFHSRFDWSEFEHVLERYR
jgi:hypothetical protein